jgi:hypothetical protein
VSEFHSGLESAARLAHRRSIEPATEAGRFTWNGTFVRHFMEGRRIMDEHIQSIFEQAPAADQSLELPADGLSAPRRRLGRGISSLLGGLSDGPAIMDDSASVETATGEFLSIDERLIARNPYQQGI